MDPVDQAVAFVLDREGGIKDVGDGKGVTYFGQTTGWLQQFNLPTPGTRDAAAANYRTWLRLTKIGQVLDPAGYDELASIVIDIAVMSDYRKGTKALQQALGVPVDGVWGPATQDALSRCDRRQTAKNIIAWDMEYQGRLVTQDPTGRAQYAAGWAARMAVHVRNL